MMINLQVKDPKYRIVKNFNEPLNVPVYERDIQESWALSLENTTFKKEKEEKGKKKEKEEKGDLLLRKRN
jgi:hypothetical protein